MFNLSYSGFANAWRHHAAAGRTARLVEAGCDPQAAHLDNGAFLSSLAMLSLGVPVAGSLRIATGPQAGGRVFTGANDMADWLAHCFAPPETFPIDHSPVDIADRLFGRRGIVAFISGSGPQGGLIGLADGSNAHALCAAAQIRHPLEARFWELH